MRAFALEITAGDFAFVAGYRRIVRLDLARAFFLDSHIGMTKTPRSQTTIRG
jgi:hypothetical protein